MRVLATINAHALAHVSRALEVAKALRKRGHGVAFAGYGKYLKIAASEGFDTTELPFIPLKQLEDAVRSQRLDRFYQEGQLFEFVDAELGLYREINPDLVIVDDRVTAPTSAELAGIPSVSIVNVHMTNYRKIPFYSLRNTLKLSPRAWLDFVDKIENMSEFLLWDKIVMRGMHQVRRKHGLKRRFSYVLGEGNRVLLADVPEFNPVSSLPGHAVFVGPLTWHNDLPAPQAAAVLDPSKKCIYLTIGSSGLEELIERMSVLAAKDVQIVIATGEERTKADYSLPDNMFLEQYVNTDELLPHCDLVVCHGGNGTIYQTLAYGLPIVGISTHAEQDYGLKRVNQLELGIGMTHRRLVRGGYELLVKAVNEALNDPRYRANAKRFQNILAQYNGPENAADMIERFWTNRTAV